MGRDRPSASDAAEREQAEAALAHLAAIVESSDDAIIGETLDGKITSWNAAAQRIYGDSAAETIGNHVSMLLADGGAEELAELFARVRRGQHITNLETRRRRKDGGIIEVSLTMSPIRDRAGAIVGASAIARDITDRKLVERARERTLADLEDAQRIARLGSWSWDPATDQAHWPAQMYEIFGRDPALGPVTGEAFFERDRRLRPAAQARGPRAAPERARRLRPNRRQPPTRADQRGARHRSDRGRSHDHLS